MLGRNFTLLFFIFLLFSCSSENPEKLDDQEYFPLESGRYSDFEVGLAQYRIDEPDQIARYHYKKTIADSFYRADGQKVFPFQYSSQTDGTFWKTDSITAGWRASNRFFEQENGKPVIKISLPVFEGSHWNANTFNVNNKRECNAVQVDKSYQIRSLFFPNTITIVIQDDSTLLSRKKYIEIYARNVGLIRRERLYLQYCYTADCIGKGVINSGWKEITTIQNFSKK
ncbi:hypothetical protein [Dyadobacter arcticus]|uniref:Lipoprotein n=1 Tax=Dyadobacter arcticus TaxID=1078754 RepID=A0ABX0UK70_9BACT|nr:hypothetical protein [Dyadobacter arcticus]NIJ51975.1 hypothetical protein [Dyadobacter arcticus]